MSAIDPRLLLPGLLLMVYAIMSLVTLCMYAIDKSAAGKRGPRISERSLLLCGLAGGWPGAIVAQSIFRHKTQKTSFRRAFFATIILNLALLIAVIVIS
ncbi:DUF1294 domain-containing protein [Undibacterium sp. CY18W]|uniref:DUF1294 domain-containing protein n=1 Tax=Undibacterium hunanense TaxID=2762292 RepID=A0ABR6ZW39_9BURK|nr:DUF1294 domain-containing protein [Undibacterium hunanense]MBC3920092.1 DUF1294 domain-containing protein [Undibacterium hunanense]